MIFFLHLISSPTKQDQIYPVKRPQESSFLISSLSAFSLLLVSIWITLFSFYGCTEPEIQLQSPIASIASQNQPESSQTFDIIHAPLSLKPLAHQLEKQIPSIRKQLVNKLGLSIPKAHIFLQPSHQKMIQLATQHHSSVPPEWAHGLAYPKKAQIYLQKAPLNQLKSTLYHEYVHIALGGVPNLPLWLNEGLSVFLSEGLSWQRSWALNESASLGTLLSFNQITHRFPYSSTQAQLAYAQSAHFISYLYSHFGDQHVQKLLQSLKKGQNFNTAFADLFEKSLYSIEDLWKKQFKLKWGWIFFILQESTIWAIVILLFIIRGFKIIFDRKKKIREMIQQDQFTYEQERTQIIIKDSPLFSEQNQQKDSSFESKTVDSFSKESLS